MTIIIDSTTFDVPVASIKEVCDFLDKYAERTEDGVLKRELIGTYHNHQIQFGAHASTTELAALWLKLCEPVEFHEVTVPDTDGTSYTYTAYFASVNRDLLRVNDAKTFWKNLAAHFVSRDPRRTP